MQLLQPRRWAAAQCSQRVGQASGLDEVGGGAIEVALAHQRRDAGQPADGPRLVARRAGPQVLVPAGRRDARAVAAGMREVAVGPGHPGAGDLELLLAGLGLLEQRRIGLGSDVGLQCGQVPGAADDGDALETLLLGRAQALAHVGLAQQVVQVALAHVGAQRSHRFGDGGEQMLAVAALFHLVVPPGLAIGVAGGFGQAAQRVCTQLSLITVMAQRLRDGQVDEARRHGGGGGPAQGLPLGGELCEGVVHRAAGLVRCVTQQCHWRLHAFV